MRRPSAEIIKALRETSLERSDPILRGIKLQCGSNCNWGIHTIRAIQRKSSLRARLGKIYGQKVHLRQFTPSQKTQSNHW
jgi:hypothetical protein